MAVAAQPSIGDEQARPEAQPMRLVGAQVEGGWLGGRGRTRSGCFGYDSVRRDSHRVAFAVRVPLSWGIGVVGEFGSRSRTARAWVACSEDTFSRTASWPGVIGVPCSVRYCRAM